MPYQNTKRSLRQSGFPRINGFSWWRRGQPSKPIVPRIEFFIILYARDKGSQIATLNTKCRFARNLHVHNAFRFLNGSQCITDLRYGHMATKKGYTPRTNRRMYTVQRITEKQKQWSIDMTLFINIVEKCSQRCLRRLSHRLNFVKNNKFSVDTRPRCLRKL